jgi:hypothetical protein
VRQNNHVARHFLGHSNQAASLVEEGRQFYRRQYFSGAARSWARAAILGNAHAHALLANVLFHGRSGVRKDVDQAFEVATAGADLSCMHCCGLLGECYLDGRGVERDEAKGLQLATASCKAGSCFGQTVLGIFYYKGRGGLKRSSAAARRLWNLAAHQGHANAYYYLACKLGRNNTATDDKWAFRLCNVAATQGFSLAQHHLGRLLHRGVGVARDLAKARVFYSLAAQQGCDGAREDLELTKTWFRTLV